MYESISINLEKQGNRDSNLKAKDWQEYYRDLLERVRVRVMGKKVNIDKVGDYKDILYEVEINYVIRK